MRDYWKWAIGIALVFNVAFFALTYRMHDHENDLLVSAMRTLVVQTDPRSQVELQEVQIPSGGA